MTGYAIDVSSWNAPNWQALRGKVDAVICRAGYGTMRDKRVEEHAHAAGTIGAKVGLYLFYRPSQSVDDQWARLCEVAHMVCLGPGDIVPTLDIEADPLPKRQEVTPEWSEPCREFVERIAAKWGDAMVYMTRADWTLMGRPAWVTERPLWVAHYTAAAKPAVPGDRQPVMWQHRVGPFDPSGPGGYVKSRPELDQNRILAPLPLIPGTPGELDPISSDLRARASRLVTASVEEEAMRIVRGHAIDTEVST